MFALRCWLTSGVGEGVEGVGARPYRGVNCFQVTVVEIAPERKKHVSDIGLMGAKFTS